VGDHPGLPGPPTVAGDARGIEIGFGVMVGGYFMEIAALFVQPQPATFAVLVIILDLHADGKRRAAWSPWSAMDLRTNGLRARRKNS
jgi:hypothetical protein